MQWGNIPRKLVSNSDFLPFGSPSCRAPILRTQFVLIRKEFDTNLFPLDVPLKTSERCLAKNAPHVLSSHETLNRVCFPSVCR